MPRQFLTPTLPSLPGTPAQFVLADAAGDAIRPGSALLVRNGGASPITLTLVTGGSAGNYAVEDPTLSVPAGAMRFVGGFDRSVFPQPSGADEGWIYVNYSAVASVDRICLPAPS